MISLSVAEPLEHENVFTLQWGGEWIADSYLSPLLYSGQYIAIGNEWWQPFRHSTPHIWSKTQGDWSNIGNARVVGGRCYNTAMTNYIYNLGVQGGWGALYNWTWNAGSNTPSLPEVTLMLGPYADLDFRVREIGSNVNKPLSFDFGLDADAMVGVSCIFRCKSTAYRLHYLATTNLIGIEWLPDYWTSYYEVSQGVNIDGSIAFSWLANRHNLHQQLSLDMQFKRVTWRLGVQHEYLRYGRKGMYFSNQSVGLVVGLVWKYKAERSKL